MVFKILAYHLASEAKKLACDLMSEPQPDGRRNLVFIAKAGKGDAGTGRFVAAAALLNKMGRPYGISIAVDHEGAQISGIRINWQVEDGASPGGIRI